MLFLCLSSVISPKLLEIASDFSNDELSSSFIGEVGIETAQIDVPLLHFLFALSSEKDSDLTLRDL